MNRAIEAMEEMQKISKEKGNGGLILEDIEKEIQSVCKRR